MTLRLLVAVLLTASATPSVFAQSPSTPGSIWARSRLTGDWWGARSYLADHGVTFDLEYTSTLQGLVSGTEDKDSGYGGKVDAFFNLHSGKLGLWEGGGLRTHIEYRHGDARANLGGALFAVNTAQLWPVGAPEEVVATSIYFTQEIGDRIDILAGKVNPVDLLAADPFIGGWGIRRFMNLIFVAPPSGLVPPVFMGAVASIKTKPALWTIMVFDPNDRTTDYFPGDLFSDGVNVSASGAHAAKLAERNTTYTVTVNYSTAEGVDYSTFPPGIETTTKTGAYNIAFQFTHNLEESKDRPDDSWGIYFKAAIADGNPNYVKASVMGGIGGKALFLARPQDSFGLGAFYYNLSDELEETLDPSIDFGDEAAVEAFYSWSVTPWLHVGCDIQYIHPASGGRGHSLIAALRANIRF
jgi:porin